MTEQEARDKAEGLASCMGITFYVVRSPQGDLLTVQAPPDDCEIIATVPPPDSPHDQGLERQYGTEPSYTTRGFQ